MRKNKDISAAEFCEACYNYLRANDDRGIRIEIRILMMMDLYKEVVSRFAYPKFPLYGRETISGFNVELAEEILVVSVFLLGHPLGCVLLVLPLFAMQANHITGRACPPGWENRPYFISQNHSL